MSRVLEMLQRPRKSFTVEDFFPIEAGSLDSNCALLALFNAKPVSPESPLELPNFCGAKRISTSEFSPPSGEQTASTPREMADIRGKCLSLELSTPALTRPERRGDAK